MGAKRTLASKTALVTGGSKGIGRAICVRLAQAGCRIVVNYASSDAEAEQTKRLIEAHGAEALLFKGDVAASDNVQKLVDYTLHHFHRIDVLVNNAGIMTDSLVETMDDAMWSHVLQTNLSGAFYACRAVIPAMKAQRRGYIVNISSQAALTGSAQHAHYAAAKAGLLGLTYSLAKELGPHQITVNAVSPGRIVTDMIETRGRGREQEWIGQTPLGRLGDAADVAGAVAYLVSGEADYVTGMNLQVNGGLVMG
jgi:3-oxoacyl-[acyl-carrier protein] reductase